MFYSLPLYIGLRYTRSKRRNGFIAFVSLFAMLGMALGVFALIVVLSVMNGFDRELKERILRVIPHASLATEQPLEDWAALQTRIESTEGLIGSAPYVEGQGLLSFGGAVKGIQIQGIDPDAEQSVASVSDFLVVGSLQALNERRYGIVLGSLLARYLGVTLGDSVTVTLPELSITPAGVFPRSKRFTVTGVFEVGAQVDQTLALIGIQDAKKVFRRGAAVDGLYLRFEDIYQAPTAVAQMRRQLGSGYIATDWSETQGSLFQAVKMEKTVVGVMLSIIIAVAAFNIVTSLIMMVTEKRSDIAVLRTMGLSRSGIVSVFVIQGVAMGLLGVAVGSTTGVMTAIYLSDLVQWLEKLMGLQVFDPEVYFVSSLPSLWQFDDTLRVCLLSVIFSVLATLYPAYRASKVEPAEALRYDM